MSGLAVASIHLWRETRPSRVPSLPKKPNPSDRSFLLPRRCLFNAPEINTVNGLLEHRAEFYKRTVGYEWVGRCQHSPLARAAPLQGPLHHKKAQSFGSVFFAPSALAL